MARKAPKEPAGQRGAEDQTDELIADASQRLDRLKIEWEKYFLGIERMTPDLLMDQVMRLMGQVQGRNIQRTATRFRAGQLRERWSSLRMYWLRNQKQIEDGTHPRQRRKLDIKEREQALADRAGTPQKPVRRQNTTHGHDSAELFQDLLAARRECGQSTSGLDPARLAQQLAGQVEKIKQQTGAGGVRFRVVIEDGKPKVKATTL